MSGKRALPRPGAPAFRGSAPEVRSVSNADRRPVPESQRSPSASGVDRGASSDGLARRALPPRDRERSLRQQMGQSGVIRQDVAHLALVGEPLVGGHERGDAGAGRHRG